MNPHNLAGVVFDTPEGAFRIVQVSVENRNISEAHDDTGKVIGVRIFGQPDIIIKIEPLEPTSGAVLLAEMNEKLQRKYPQPPTIKGT